LLHNYRLLKTNHIDSSGNSYLGSGENILTVEIDEAGVGFHKANVDLDLTNIGGGQKVKATNCSITSAVWKCYWYNFGEHASEGTKQISIKANSVDDLDNQVTGTSAYNVIVDQTNPTIGGISYTPSAPVSGDTLTLTFNVQDNSPITPSVNASKVSATPIHYGTCSNNVCTVNINNLVSSHTIADIQVIAEDAAGNIAAKQKEVTIYQSDSSTTPSFFRVSDIELIPSRVDKKVASQLAVNIYVHVTLQEAGSGESIGKTVDCTEMANHLAESPYLMNEYEDDPYIVIKTNTAVGTLDSLPIRCKLRLMVKDNQNVYSELEEEDITAELELYGNALGDIEENIEDKLEAINNEIEDVESDIDSWEQWLKILGMWCTIAQMMGTLNSVIQNFKITYYMFTVSATAAEAATDATLFTAATAEVPLALAAATASSVCPGPCVVPCVPCAAAITAAIPVLALDLKVILASAAADSIVANKPAAMAYVATLTTVTTACSGCPTAMALLTPALVSAAGGEASAIAWLANVAAWVSVCTWGNWFHVLVESVFWPSGMIGLPVGMISKYGCSITFNCALCDFNTIASLAVSLGGNKLNNMILDGSVSTGYSSDKMEKALSDNKLKTAANTNNPTQKVTTNADATKTPAQLQTERVLQGAADSQTRLGSLFGTGTDTTTDTGTDTTTDTGTDTTTDTGTDTTSSTLGGVKNFFTTDLVLREWMKTGKYTEIPDGDVGEDSWIFNPYKSIHYAEACLCIPAIAYNQKKDMQIKCMYRNCIQHHINAGIPTTNCDLAYKERECLYIESAQFKLHGYMGGFFDNLLDFLWANLPYLLSALGYLAFCSQYKVTGSIEQCTASFPLGVYKTGNLLVLCGIWGTVQTTLELISVFNSEFSMNNYDQDLEGEDYCSSGGY